jgi:hypothetical protein
MEKIKTDRAMEQKYNLRLTAIICSTIIAVMSIIGLFWGKTGLEMLGVAILIVMVIMIMVGGQAQ